MKRNLLPRVLKNKLWMLCLLLIISQSVFGAIIYVDGARGTGAQNGQSWTTAYSKLEDAISASVAGDEIWVAKGTYIRNSGAVYWYSLKNGVKIYGGFLPGATQLSDRNWKSNSTILKGYYYNNIWQNTDVNSSAVLDGFIIRDALTTAMLNTRSSPTLNNIDFINNVESNSDPKGGAMRNIQNSNPILTNVRFIGNKVITGTNSWGGAIYNSAGCTVTLTNVVFSENKNESTNFSIGGAIYNAGNLILNNTVFDRNQCTGNTNNLMGGAIYSQGGNVKVSNTIFTGNSAYYGAMIHSDGATYEIVHTTGYKNVYTPSSWYSGMSFIGNSTLKIANSIFIANNSGSFSASTLTDIKNSFFDVNYPSVTANMSVGALPFTNPVNPMGEDGEWFTADDGLQIALNAKVTPIDKGLKIAVPTYSGVLADNSGKDILGVTRPKGSAYDPGAYEAVINRQIFYVDGANQSGVQDGSSWATSFNKLEDALLQAANYLGSMIWVAKGTYAPPANQAFKIGQTISVYGGFTNTSTDFSQRDWEANPTILKGSGAGVIDNDYPNDANHVMGWAVIDGFTITGGRNTKGGAGMFNKYMSPDLKNLIFLDNETTGSGGAIYSEGSSSFLTNVTFKDNKAGINGGAIFTTAIANPLTYDKVVFINNTANNGGAMASSGNNFALDVTNTVFENNHAVYGGAAHNSSVWPLTFTNTVFAGNTADFTAAVHNMTSGVVSYLNVSFSKNIATNHILLTSQQVNCPVTNGVFWGNSTSFNRISFYSCYGQQGGTTSPFVNADVASGPDGVWKTSDDGIQLKYQEGAINKGNVLNDGNSYLLPSMLNAAKKDILGINRTTPLAYDLGAYEYVLPNFSRFYVDSANTAALKNGGSWATAYSNLDQALADANLEAGDTIWVAKGTYQPAVNQSFIMKEGVKIYGGFLNTHSDESERSYKQNETVLKGNGVVVVANNFTTTSQMTANSLLDGFTITAGKGGGAGIFNNYASPTLQNLIIKNNDAGFASGGGLFLSSSSSVIENVIIDNNKAGYGAGIALEFNAAPVLKNVIISNNISTGDGGGIDIYSASVELSNVVFSGNRANNNGGGISSYDGMLITSSNVVFHKNIATDGAGFYGAAANSKFTNITFASNTSSANGSCAYIEGNGAVVNSVFWDNTGSSSSPDVRGTSFTLNHSFIQQNSPSNGVGNIKGTASPFLALTNAIGEDGFWFTADDGLQPAKGSPIINAGSNTAVTGLLIDITGRDRIFDTTIDMGAYEAFPGSDASLKSLTLSEGTLNPIFNPGELAYEVELQNSVENISVTAIFGDAAAKLTINNGAAIVLNSGTASAALALLVGQNQLVINVKAADSIMVKTYTINVMRAKANQQINPIATIEKFFGDADFEPGAAASSNLIVAYASADETIAKPYQDAEDSGKWKIKLLKSGTVNITASQPGNSNYNAAENVVFSLKINKGLATTVLNNLTATYDGTGKSVTLTTSPAGLTGMAVTYNGLTTLPTAAGSYTVIARLNNENYAAEQVSGTFVIDKGTQDITFPQLANRNTNSPNFEPGVSVNTGLVLSYSSENVSVAEVFQDNSDDNKWKIRIVGAGTTNITVLQAGNDNYKAASVSRTLTVEHVTLPVTLTSFQAKREENRVWLGWNISAMSNHSHFVVLRSSDGKIFEHMAKVIEPAQTDAGNFSVYDPKPYIGDNYYRLVQYDLNGKSEIFGERLVNFKLDDVVSVRLFPNPSIGDINLSLQNFKASKAQVTVIGMSGMVWHRETLPLKEGGVTLKLNISASRLPWGTYLIQVDADGMKKTLKLLVGN